MTLLIRSSSSIGFITKNECYEWARRNKNTDHKIIKKYGYETNEIYMNNVFSISVEEIKPHPINSQIYDLSGIEELKKSIESKGLLEPLVITKDKIIISGHRRYEVIKNLGWSSVQVRRVETLSSDEEIELLIHSNQQRVKTCKEILNEYEYLSEIIPSRQGKRSDLDKSDKSNKREEIANEINVPSSTIGKMLFIKKESPNLIEEIDKGKASLNQVYIHCKRNKNRKENLKKSIPDIVSDSTSEDFIFYNKCSSNMSEIDSESINTIFTSPPYYKKRLYDSIDELGNEKDSKTFVSHLVEHLEDCKRVLTSNGSMFIVIGDTYENKDLQNVPHRLVISLQDRGWLLRNTIIWKKINPKPNSSKTSLNTTYEFIFHLVKNTEYKYHEILSPSIYTTTTYSRMNKTNTLGKNENLMRTVIPRDGRNIGDFWTSDIIETTVAKNLNDTHPAPMTDEVCILPILMTTDINDTVLDPFSGLGTVGKVANRLQRRFIGYDIKKYS